MRSLRSHRQAFTLIELLVVIAIIAILASILFPVFGRARENARRSSCQSNIKQILLGFTQYTQDYDEYFPRYSIAVSGSGSFHNALWDQALQPYLKSSQIFVCPSDTGKTVTSWADPAPPNGMAPPFHTSYIGSVPIMGTPISLAAAQQPSTTVLLCDGGVNGMTTAPFVTETPKAAAWALQDPTTGANSSLVSVPGEGDWAAPSTRHLETSNVGFVDGHVKALRIEKWYYGNTPWLDPAHGGA